MLDGSMGQWMRVHLLFPMTSLPQVEQQTYRQLRLSGLDEACWLWPSITQNAYQTAEILASLLYVGRSRVSLSR